MKKCNHPYLCIPGWYKGSGIRFTKEELLKNVSGTMLLRTSCGVCNKIFTLKEASKSSS